MSLFPKLSTYAAIAVAAALSSNAIAAHTTAAKASSTTPPAVKASATTSSTGKARSATPSKASTTKSLTSTSKKPATKASSTSLDQHIHDYIMNNPEVILQAVQKYQQDQQLKARKAKFDAALEQVDALRTPMYNTVAGNPNGSITMVEFFDYQCIMCYRVYKDVDKLIANNKDLRVVFRLLPIFGKASVYAAKVDIAAALQHKYAKFHDILFKAKRVEGKLKDADVRKAAKQAGVHLTSTVMKEIEGKKGQAFLKENTGLAKKLRINGTPAFYIMPTKGSVTKDQLAVFAGAVPGKYLQQAIDKVAGKDAAAQASNDSSDSDLAGDDQVDTN